MSLRGLVLLRPLIIATAALGLLPAAMAAARSQRPMLVPAGTITTIAGGVGGPARATTVGIDEPCGLAFAGQIYIAQSAVIRQVNPATDHLMTPAGVGIGGTAPDGTPATAAELTTAVVGACGVAADSHGDLAVTAPRSNEIRLVPASSGTYFGQVMTAGDIYTVAGDGIAGFSGDGGPAGVAELTEPTGVAFDGSGNLVIADRYNSRIRVVAAADGTFYGEHMNTGDIYTIAGDGTRGHAGDGGPATAAQLNWPKTVAFDGAGNLVIADTGNDRVRLVAASTGEFYGQHVTAGDIYTIAGDGSENFSGDGGPATSAGLTSFGVAVDRSGNLVIADPFNDRVRLVAASTGDFYGLHVTAGDIYTIAGDGIGGFAGDGGPAPKAELYGPQAVAVDAAGNVLIADWLNNRVRAVAARKGTFYRTSMTTGDIYTVAGNGSFSYSGDSGPAARAQLILFDSSAVRADSAGNIVLADSFNNRIRVVATRSGIFYGRSMRSGAIYTVAGDGSATSTGPRNGLRATAAPVSFPEGVAFGRAGSLLIAASSQYRVVVVAERSGHVYGLSVRAGDIYVIGGDGRPATRTGRDGDGGPAIKAQLGSPTGVAADHHGNVLVVDSQDNRIRVIAENTGRFYGRAMTAGDIYTIAGNGNQGFSGDGGPAVQAELSVPYQVAVDGAGSVLIADTFNSRVRVVAAHAGTFYGQSMLAGDIYTIAGTGIEGSTGNGGPAAAAEISFPADLAVDAHGNIVLAVSCQVRVIAASTGEFYGQHMVAGDIYLVAGSATCGFSGDRGPALQAQLCGANAPEGVAVTRSSELVIGDCIRIRKVAS